MSALSVLLLDDDPILRRATTLMIGARGASVTTASTVAELVALASKRIYDVAVVDLGQRGESGAEIVAKLRAGGLVPRRIVVCSPTPVERREAEVFTQVLVKPFAFRRLVAAIFGSANRRRPTRSGVFSRVAHALPPARGPRGGDHRPRSPASPVPHDDGRTARRGLRVVPPLDGSEARWIEPAAEARSPGVIRAPRRAVRVRRGRG